MNETLTLDESPRALSRAPYKTIACTIAGVFLIGAYTSVTIYKRVSEWYPQARQRLILDAIDSDLAVNPLQVNLQDRRKLNSGNASKDDLLKLLYLQRVRLEQYEQDMTVIRDVLAMPRAPKEESK